MKKLDAELQQKVASLMKDPSQRQALAEFLVEYSQPEHVMTDFIGMLMNTRNLNIGR